MRSGLITYLASPYSHPDASVRTARYEAACLVAGVMMRRGDHVFSPIAHHHPIAARHGLSTGFDYWEAYDLAMLSRCDRLAVLAIDGWRESVGVQAEIAMAVRLGLPTTYVDTEGRDAYVGPQQR